MPLIEGMPSVIDVFEKGEHRAEIEDRLDGLDSTSTPSSCLNEQEQFFNF